MLERIREGSQGVVAKTILGLVILTFALAGVGSYLSSPTDVAVAVVNGEEINQTQFEQALQRDRARMQQQFGEMYDTIAADPAYNSRFRSEVLERLIDETLQQQFVRKLGIRVGDDQVRDTIRSLGEFQVDGTFNNDRYIALLRQMGYQSADFREMVREDMAASQFRAGVFASEFYLPSEMQQIRQLEQQSRDISYFVVKAESFADQVSISEQMIEDYYQMQLQRFETEPKVAAEYVELSAAALADDIEVTDQQIQTYYEANQSRYSTAEQREVAHIMLESDGTDEAIAAEAASLLSQLQQGADFAQLAKEHSDDTFSAENGGVLESLEPGQMDPDFEQAAFALTEAGQLTDVVKSEYGYHIIKLVSLTPSQQQPLAEVRDDIAERLKQEQATEQFYQLQTRMAEVAFEVPDNLEETAAVLGQRVRSTPLFSKEQATAPLDFPAVTSKLFDQQFVADGLNSDPIEVGNQHLVVVRVKEFQPARTLPLEEVRAQITESIKVEQQAKLAQEKVNALLQEQADLASLAEQAGSTVQAAPATPRFGGTLDPEIRTKAFKLARPVAGQPSIDSVTLANGDVAVVSVSAVQDVEVTAVPAEEELDRMAQRQAEQGYLALVATLKANAEISRNLRATAQEQN
ncbi:SurA N-terminal domain-containing protein [Arsukibacterium indicum]|uniref:SurA N-terminal domain-containing protein n=1 Tax=Arsukibacterium indicum TaxID=2848612 RepID=A0ABS6MI68_9GAMM|nr:SurA N-terminal domain-containing protein [Arsukibacterium indicum]MBV2128074.1 SurA N-terminal domain-containing protein [Arsukibacterium indicum]